MRVVPVPVREDNYAYLIIDEPSNKAAAVDVFDTGKVVAKAKELGVNLVAALTTHHHFDHSGGNKAKEVADVPIYGGSVKVLGLTHPVKDGDEFTIGDNIKVKCLATPCHTQDSICYYITDEVNKNHPGGVFTGDTLFIAGCGRFFEGDGAEMHAALTYLGTLPEDTVVYNGHEYTSASLRFGKHIDPTNSDLDRLADIVEKNEQTTGLTTIGDEKKWNVFMRLDSEAVRAATGAVTGTADSKIMDELRGLKNAYRG